MQSMYHLMFSGCLLTAQIKSLKALTAHHQVKLASFTSPRRI